ncbi:LysE/ArgO family amino acid transporter [Pseudomonas japonica]|uniref:LysE/ArgO family amino acid transporter n=1 Tax=Pseudomonas japonica TaxID=256466 RepID=UPI00382B96EA
MTTPFTPVFLEGLLLGLGLFSAPGPKDTLVIHRGVSGHSVWGIVAICVVADVILIALGISGLAGVFAGYPLAISLLLLSGAIYLAWFGWQRLRACVLNQSFAEMQAQGSLDRGALKEALLLSFANPYAWLDTIILIGPIGVAKPPSQQLSFASGAMAASLLWFVLLALGSTRASALFRSARAWRLLDGAVALLMAYLASGLMIELLHKHFPAGALW